MTKKTRNILIRLQLIFQLVGLVFILFDSRLWMFVAFSISIMINTVMIVVKKKD